ncbi:MAG: Gfo/Idh/MocA family oxidoreductase [Clostridia bacterium]|nr:Gfo/Idh/MocA family oxidoreductase [Clostridia bacterium]
MRKKICVIGGGRWGQNHIKTLFEMGNLAGIVEADADRLSELLQKYPVQGFTDLDEAISSGFDGYTIATPAVTHYTIGKKLLELGNHVLIEKPLTLSSTHAGELVAIAEKNGSSLMVGHVMLFHPAIRKIKELVLEGKIGQLHYIYSTRLNFGTVRTEESVFWSFAPHDISILNYLAGGSPVNIEAKGSKFLQGQVYDVTMAQLEYPDNLHGHIFVSWLHPFKEQRLVLIGSKGMLSYEDSTKEKEILYYEKHFEIVNGQLLKYEEPDQVIPYEKALPLSEELKYFVDHLDTGIQIADGQSGYEVVKVLERVHGLITQTENIERLT